MINVHFQRKGKKLPLCRVVILKMSSRPTFIAEQDISLRASGVNSYKQNLMTYEFTGLLCLPVCEVRASFTQFYFYNATI